MAVVNVGVEESVQVLNRHQITERYGAGVYVSSDRSRNQTALFPIAEHLLQAVSLSSREAG